MKLWHFFPGVFSVGEKHLVLTICPRHRAEFGIRWRTRKTLCQVPKELAAHKSISARGSHCVDSRKSLYIFRNANILVPVGSRTYVMLVKLFLNNRNLITQKHVTLQRELNL